MTKEELNKELEKLRLEYFKAKDFISRKYIIERIIDFLENLKNQKYPEELIEPIKSRLKDIEKITQIYDYSLAEQLKEQKTIVSDSIQSSPFHIKRLELKNTAMIQFPEQSQN